MTSPSPELTESEKVNAQFLPRVYRGVAIVALASLVGLSILGATPMAATFGFGAFLSVGLLYSTERLVRGFLTPTDRPRQGRRRLIALMLAKLPLVLGILFLVSSAKWFHPIGLILGLALMPTIVTVCGVFWLFSPENDRKLAPRASLSGFFK